MPYGVDYGDLERRLAIAIAEALGSTGSSTGGSTGGTVAVSNFPAIQNVDIAKPAIQRVPINISTTGDNTIVGAVAGTKVKVLGLFLVSAGDVVLTIKSGAATNLSGAIPLAARGNGFVLPMFLSGYHLMESASGGALVFNLSAAVAVTGALAYLQEA